MLRKRVVGLIAVATLVSACNGEIGGVASGFGRDAPSEDFDGGGPDEDFNSSETPGPPDPLSTIDPTCPSAAAVLTTRNGWNSKAASRPASDTLDLELMVRPEAQDMDALVAVGSQELDGFSDAAILVRFADDGFIDARDGAVYDHDVPVAYEAGAWYSVLISADVDSRTYDVEVGRCGESREALITEAAFRSDAPVEDQLSTWGAWSSKSAKLDVSAPSWIAAGTCTPVSCESLGLQCGSVTNGCGGSLDCGSCAAGETCMAGGVCMPTESVPPTPTPTPPPPAPAPAPEPAPAPAPAPPPSGDASKPSPSNTGVIDAGALRSWPYGSRTITQSGVYEDFTATSEIRIEADNVTLRNCRITGGYYNIHIESSASNVVIEDCELTQANNCALDYGNGTTFRRVWCHDQQSDGMKFAGSNTVLEYSLLEKIGMNGTSGHHDLVQATGCSNCEIRYSALQGETCTFPLYHQSVAVIVESLPNEFLIRDSWLEGGSAPSIINGSSAAATRLRNNKFGTYFNSAVYSGGSFINDGGNVYECDGSPINSGNAPKPACAVPFPGPRCQ